MSTSGIGPISSYDSWKLDSPREDPDARERAELREAVQDAIDRAFKPHDDHETTLYEKTFSIEVELELSDVASTLRDLAVKFADAAARLGRAADSLDTKGRP